MTTGPAADETTLRMPWAVLEDYRCFGCSPRNAHGLALTFRDHPDGLVTTFRLGRGFESYPGVVHGGLTGVICDETMGNLIVLTDGRSAFTTSMRMRYLAPLMVGRAYECVARWRAAPEGELLHLAASVFDDGGAEVAAATASYRPFDLDRLALSPADRARLSPTRMETR